MKPFPSAWDLEGIDKVCEWEDASPTERIKCDAGFNHIISITLNGRQLSIPTAVKHLKYLKELSITRGSLKGSIPDEIGSLSNLEMLRLKSNKLKGNGYLIV